jgi:GNAT superfamily N-acetyltransferase
MEFKIQPSILNDESIEIELIHFGLSIGHIIFSEIISGYEYFENEFSEDEYYDIFTEDKYLYIQQLYVDKKWRGKGIANKLMNKFFEHSKRKYPKFNQFVLNACPIELSIPLNLLKKFYESFGFLELISYRDNCVMLKENN